MSILVFQHHPSETTSVLGRTLTEHGHRLNVINLHEGDPLPVDLDDVSGLVIMGGPQNVDETTDYPWLEGEMEFIRNAKERGLPMVGICLGAQLIAKALGGEVGGMAKPEVGFGMVKLTMPKFVDPVMQGIRWEFPAFHLHGQEVTKLPPGGMPIAMSDACKIQAFRVGLNIYCFQYHFEADRALIQTFAQFPLMQKGGLDAEAVKKQLDEYYTEYRRLGDRLCENITLLLMPVDRPLSVR